MIARLWHGRTTAANADRYLEFLRKRALPDYRSVPGNVAAFVLRRIEGDVAHFRCITHWTSLAAIRAFAGEEVTRAKYYPEDDDFLLEFEVHVEHYEVYS